MSSVDFVVVITAKGHSERLPNKNLLEMGGMSLVEIAIRQAIAAGIAQAKNILLTSDSELILWEAEVHGVTPVRRPKTLCQPDSSSWDAVVHALRWHEQVNSVFARHWALLQPTSPLRTPDDIWETAECARLGFAHTYTEGSKEGKGEEWRYPPNGAVYAGRLGYDGNVRLLGGRWNDTHPVSMPPSRSIDINTEEDFLIAKKLFENPHGEPDA